MQGLSLTSLTLKEASYGTVVDREWCVQLSHLLQSLPCLQHFALWSVMFESLSDWEIVLDALRSHECLETVSFFRLQTADRQDFSAVAEQDPCFVEKRLIGEYLQKHSSGGARIPCPIDFKRFCMCGRRVSLDWTLPGPPAR